MRVSGRNKEHSQIEYAMRHLRPANLTPLRRQLKKQLSDLKDVNARQQLSGGFSMREGGRYLHNILISKETSEDSGDDW